MMADETHEGRIERIAQNQAVCRDVNERIEELQERLHLTSTLRDFMCECFDTSCSETVSLTIAEYESVRADGNLFPVRPSPEHVVLDIEDVIHRFDRYWTVKKRGRAAEIVEALDPRASAEG